MKRPSRTAAVMSSLAFFLIALTGCSNEEKVTNAAPPIPVALAPEGIPKTVKVGVIVSLTSTSGEGTDWRLAAEGAQVAAYRFGLGGSTVEITAVSDRGSEEGAIAAVDELEGLGVAGIVVASSGSHITAVIDRAKMVDIPALLPYETLPEKSKGAVWGTGPSHQAIGKTLLHSVSMSNAQNPLVVDVGGGTPEGFIAAKTLVIDPAIDPATMTALLSARLNEPEQPDALIISGSTNQQAAIVHIIQGTGLDMPILLTPQATSPAFAHSLVSVGASLGGNFVTVGRDSGDSAAMRTDNDGRAISAFLSATRLTAADKETKNLFSEVAFSEVAQSADVASHDAVVAIVNAAARAGSSTSTDVATALAQLKLSHDDGLAGPDLDFTSPTALSEDAVVPLRSSLHSTGLRPEASEIESHIYWFGVPAKK